MKNFYIAPRFYVAAALLVSLFVVAFLLPVLLFWGKMLCLLLVFLLAADAVLLFRSGSVEGSRETIHRLSNGDDNPVVVQVKNRYPFAVRVTVLDETPVQFQLRDFQLQAQLAPRRATTLRYTLRPVERGEYAFGRLNVYAESPLRLVRRRFRLGGAEVVPTYPSFLQMRRYELMAISNRLSELGVKKIRKIGQSKEFDQIREYVLGDDQRTMNWKATARRQHLMVNTYQEEKAQHVYSLLDKGRVMQMPFEGMTLLDYAINATLVVSSIALRKQDQAGLITFNTGIDYALKASRSRSQLQKILELLYREKTAFQETDYAKLVTHIRRNIPQRSLLILYTNFESLPSLERQLPYLRIIAKAHLLLVVFFENTELDELLHLAPQTTQEIYLKTIGEKFAYEKRQIVEELKKHGIQAILTRPEQLTVNTLNRYIEIKARGML